MPKGIRHDREFWVGVVDEFEAAGAAEEHREFAERHGVACDTFRRWLYKLRAEQRGRRWRTRGGRRRPKAPLALSLVEVEGAPAGDARFELELPRGLRLRVPPSFDADALRRLLAVFEEPPTP